MEGVSHLASLLTDFFKNLHCFWIVDERTQRVADVLNRSSGFLTVEQRLHDVLCYARDLELDEVVHFAVESGFGFTVSRCGVVSRCGLIQTSFVDSENT